MLPSTNKIIVACAGSGKTTFLVDEALKLKHQKVLIVTYTNENLDQIEAYFIERVGCVPPNITIKSWFTFLLNDGVRPYQNHMSDADRVRAILFQKKRFQYHPKDKYFNSSKLIYSDKVAEFFYECNKKTAGLVIKRLEKIHDRIFIDELQDLAGYDLNVLEELFDSAVNIIAVGDPRQATFSTNNALKNKQYRGSAIYAWIKQKSTKLILEEVTECHRCNQAICDLGDKLFPEFPGTISRNTMSTGHDGVFYIKSSEVENYVKSYKPVILKYSKVTDTMGYRSINIGLAKGRTFPRVLIFPTQPMINFIRTSDVKKAGDKSKLYVAITRARHSVAFVIDK